VIIINVSSIVITFDEALFIEARKKPIKVKLMMIHVPTDVVYKRTKI
jgi:hypothetical protein